MHFIKPQVPTAVETAALEHVQRHAALDLHQGRLFRADNALEPAFTGDVCQVFSIGLRDAADGRGLAAARPVGWRYIVAHPTGPTSVEIHGSAEAPRAGEITHGSLVQAAQDLTDALEAQPDLKQEEYELSLLRIPALNVTALWLRHAQGRDLIIPVSTGRPELVPGKKYEKNAFDSSIRELAVHQLSMYSDDEDTGG